MTKKNKKKKVKNNKKVVNKTTMPVEEIKTEEIQEDVKKEEKKDKKVAKKEAKQDKKENKNKKHWFKDFKAELKKIIWPNRKELLTNTIVVVVVVAIVSLIVFVLDLIFEGLTSLEVKQLEKIKGDSNVVNETVVDNETLENVVDNALADEGVALNQTGE